MSAEILHAIQANLQLSHLFVVLVGTLAGLIIGALPGLSAVSGVALLLPFTFGMEPAQGLIMLAAVYMSAEYGGSISAILINTPGTSGAACTTLDGTPLTQKGQAQEALYTSLFSGTVGGAFGGLVLLFFTPPLARASLLLGPAEIFWIAVAGLALVATLSGQNVVKGLVGVLIGVGMTLIGQDAISGDMRFMFNDYRLVGGIPLVPALLGLFAVASILGLLEQVNESVAPLIRRPGAMRFVLQKLAGMKILLLWSSILGTVVGIIPGAGASISAFVAYGEAKRISKHPEEFGHGSYEGVVAPETANNAVVGGAMVPLLALGIPGSGSAAIMFGALTVHGIIPGPRLFTERGDIVYTFMIGLMVTVVAMLIIGMLSIRWSSLIVRAPRWAMVPGVLVLSMIGTYGISNSMFDVWVLLVTGIGAYLLGKLDVPAVTIALGLVLGGLTEESFQQSVLVGQVDAGSTLAYFLSRPLSAVLMLLALGIVVAGVLQIVRERRAGRTSEAPLAADPAPADATRGASLRAMNLILGVILIALAVFVFYEARGFSEMGARFPMLVGYGFVVLGGLLLAINLHPSTVAPAVAARPFAGIPWRTWGTVVAALVLFGYAVDVIGFYEAGFLFVLFATWLLAPGGTSRAGRLLAALAFAAPFMAAIYLAFRIVLAIPTPHGLII
ncbi:MAG TPA: tripartite tricarboxylate transporter permease [Geminicoccaceae bacterium]|nr:tripartite tricarboxylate transporter permease [Geminicoccaceae bacterium]